MMLFKYLDSTIELHPLCCSERATISSEIVKLAEQKLSLASGTGGSEAPRPTPAMVGFTVR